MNEEFLLRKSNEKKDKGCYEEIQLDLFNSFSKQLTVLSAGEDEMQLKHMSFFRSGKILLSKAGHLPKEVKYLPCNSGVSH